MMDRQRILMIFGGAWISAALLTWIVYAQFSGSKAEKLTRVVAAARDLPAGTRLKKSDVKFVSVAAKDVPRPAVTDQETALGRVILFPVNSGEMIVTTKLASLGGGEGLSSTIEPGKRAISVPITDISAAGGLIQPRSKVDVLFTRTGSMREAITVTILQDVTVLGIGRTTEAAQSADGKSSGAAPRPAANATTQQAATILVTPEEARKLELARNQGKISLALRNPLDRTTIPVESVSATAEDLDPQIFAGASRAIRSGMRGPNVRDNQVWNQIAGEPAAGALKKEEKKEPPKPRLVVDVYRGDKHVQEIFQ